MARRLALKAVANGELRLPGEHQAIHRAGSKAGGNTAGILLEWTGFPKDTQVMIAYVTVGADDIARAKEFYSAILPALGYALEEGPAGLSYTLPAKPGRPPAQPDYYVKPPFDGRPASAGNGSMVAFEARSQNQVRKLHAAALAAGGSDEGQPGFRASYGPRFYVGYLRDPQGNKIALFSSNPDEPGRDG